MKIKYITFIIIFLLSLIYFLFSHFSKNNNKIDILIEDLSIEENIKDINEIVTISESDIKYEIKLYGNTNISNEIFNINLGEYYILDNNINIRNQPNLNGSIIGGLKLNDRIEVIENMGNDQIINGIHQNWYKIKFNEIIGFIFGGYISLHTLIYDLDNNGIDDYFHFRVRTIKRVYNKKYDSNDPSSPQFWDHTYITPEDIFIYFNNNRLFFNDNVIFKVDGWDSWRYWWQMEPIFAEWCSFGIYNEDTVGVDLWLTGSNVYLIKFYIDKNGSIIFINVLGV